MRDRDPQGAPDADGSVRLGVSRHGKPLKNETKNQTNIRKHGIGFDIAKRIFKGTVATSPDRRRDYGEDRHVSIGRVEPGALIVVAHTERRGRIRLISARPASRKERRIYHERTLR